MMDPRLPRQWLLPESACNHRIVNYLKMKLGVSLIYMYMYMCPHTKVSPCSCERNCVTA